MGAAAGPRPQRDAAWVRPSLIALLGIAALLVPLGSQCIGLGERLLLRRRAGGLDELEGVLLRVVRRLELHHRRQVAGRALGDGHLRADLRRQRWSILAPQALEGVATVGFTYLTVRRWFPAAAALIAGATVALTPVAALMFRFDNPDALLALLLTAATYAVVRAIEAGKTKWLVLAATLVGFAFLTKMLQAFLVVPAFALVYLVVAPVSLRGASRSSASPPR